MIGNAYLILVSDAMRRVNICVGFLSGSTIMSPVPSWLQRAYNQDHIANVWRILTDRECSRICVRSLSAASRSHPEPDTDPTTTPLSSGTHPEILTKHYSIAHGCSSENRYRNRYADIHPYDRTRVALDGRYINANWVREHAGGIWTIATQAPLPSTTHEFLSIIAGIHSPLIPPGEFSSKFTRVRTIVQVTPYFESGRQKAHPYVPFEPGESKTIHPVKETSELPPLKLTLIKAEIIENANCVVCTVSITPISAEGPMPAVMFRHLLYGAWPDNGIPEPEDRESLLSFIRLVDRTNKDLSGLEATADVEPPIMVHCSAGVGRTGSFIALSSLLRSNGLISKPNSHTTEVHPPLPQSPLGLLPESISWDEVSKEVDSLREQRPGMVQRPEQLHLIYEILIAAFIFMANGNVNHHRQHS
jgi:protein tyrosine phosphatase